MLFLNVKNLKNKELKFLVLLFDFNVFENLDLENCSKPICLLVLFFWTSAYPFYLKILIYPISVF